MHNFDVLTFILAAAASGLVEAFNVPHGALTGQAVTSHSGPNTVSSAELLSSSDSSTTHRREKRGYWFPSRYPTDNQLLVSSEPPNEYLRKWIVHEHNRFRRMVPASDMNMLYWSDELAASAQRHADTCDFRHSRGRMNVGENIWAAPYSNYSDSISIWFNEVHNPRCGCNHAYKHCCGHYVQVVWAKTNLVGCGFSRCRDVQGVWGRGHRNVFVCHYNPQGNTVFVTAKGQLYAVRVMTGPEMMPAFTWATDGQSSRCSNCPSTAPACYQGLCYMPKNHQPATTTTTSATNNGENGAPEGEDAQQDDFEQEEASASDEFQMRV